MMDDDIRGQAAAAVGEELYQGQFAAAAAAPDAAPALDAAPVIEIPSIDIMGILMRRTGEGEVGAYKTHVLNFDGKDSTARVIRGLTGMFDKDLNLAIVDLTIGIMQKVRGE